MSYCEECGTEFTPKRVTQILCGSKACKKAHRAKINKAYRAKEREGIVAKAEPVHCLICDKLFKPYKQFKITCSSECAEARRLGMQSSKERKPYVKQKIIVEIPEKYLVRGSISENNSGSQIVNGNHGG